MHLSCSSFPLSPCFSWLPCYLWLMGIKISIRFQNQNNHRGNYGSSEGLTTPASSPLRLFFVSDLPGWHDISLLLTNHRAGNVICVEKNTCILVKALSAHSHISITLLNRAHIQRTFFYFWPPGGFISALSCCTFLLHCRWNQTLLPESVIRIQWSRTHLLLTSCRLTLTQWLYSYTSDYVLWILSSQRTWHASAMSGIDGERCCQSHQKKGYSEVLQGWSQRRM